MKLVVKNFGPIKEAVIDLTKKHYFFVGYNNTGKTYISKLLYDIFSNEVQREFGELVYDKFQLEGESLTLTTAIVDTILNDFADFLKDKAIPRSLKTNGRANFILNDLILNFQYDGIEEIQKKEFSSSLGLNIGEEGIDEDKPLQIGIITINKEVDSLILKISKKKEDEFPSLLIDRFSRGLVTSSILNLLLQNKGASFFVPANRIFILENADELIAQENAKRKEFIDELNDLLENKENKDKIHELLARKPQSNQTIHISNLINLVAQLRRNKEDEFIDKGTEHYTELLAKLSKIMGGNISLSQNSLISNRREQFEFTANGQSKTIDLFLASSSVNQLSILYLYLKYWAKASNNFLIVDEPEVNLSPLNQVRLLDLLLDFANKNNNKILVTTHSPLLGQMLNNYLTLGQLNNRAEIAEQLGFQDKNVNPENTGIYYFNGETVSETTISNYGAIYTSFKSVEEEVYQINDYLGNLMFQQTNTQ